MSLAVLLEKTVSQREREHSPTHHHHYPVYRSLIVILPDINRLYYNIDAANSGSITHHSSWGGYCPRYEGWYQYHYYHYYHYYTKNYFASTIRIVLVYAGHDGHVKICTSSNTNNLLSQSTQPARACMDFTKHMRKSIITPYIPCDSSRARRRPRSERAALSPP